MHKLGKNHGRYFGETIDVASVIDQIAVAAATHGWTGETLCETGDFPIMAWHRRAAGRPADAPKIYLSAGVHGDEPAGPLAMLSLMKANRWPENIDLFIVPCLNPVGFTLNQRENAAGLDLNRDYRNPQSAECRAHIAWLERQPPFDCYFCLHEDWESHGFYLYEQNPDNKPSLAGAMIESVKAVCPVDGSEMIEDRPASGGIIRPVVKPQDRPDWPEAFYLITHKSRQGYTLEAPSDFSLETRVNALIAAVTSALEFVTANPAQFRPK